jgi:hypothetical protein
MLGSFRDVSALKDFRSRLLLFPFRLTVGWVGRRLMRPTFSSQAGPGPATPAQQPEDHHEQRPLLLPEWGRWR